MLAFLHLYLISTGNELIIKGHIRYSLRNALSDDFKRVASTSYYVSSEKYSTFNYPQCSLNRSLNKSLRWLVYDFPNPLGYVLHKNIRIPKYIDRAWYFIDFFEDFFAVELRQLISKFTQSNIFVNKSWKLDLGLRDIGKDSFEKSYNGVNDNVSSWNGFYTERELDYYFSDLDLSDKDRLVSFR